jgi:hypothetical protein
MRLVTDRLKFGLWSSPKLQFIWSGQDSNSIKYPISSLPSPFHFPHFYHVEKKNRSGKPLLHLLVRKTFEQLFVRYLEIHLPSDFPKICFIGMSYVFFAFFKNRIKEGFSFLFFFGFGFEYTIRKSTFANNFFLAGKFMSNNIKTRNITSILCRDMSLFFI